MKAFLKLIRWQNLLIVISTLLLMRYAVLGPLISKVMIIPVLGDGKEIPMVLQFPWQDFLLLIIAAVCLTAGGYIINDYFDVNRDLLNKEKIIVGKAISRRKAMLWHSVFNIAGVSAGLYVSLKSGYILLGTMFLIESGLLYFYSATYKRQFLIGNLVVAEFAAMVPLLDVLYEWPALYKYYNINSITHPDLYFIFYWTAGFSLFAFLITLSREIIRDIEDFEHGVSYERNTIPSVLGVKVARTISIILLTITVILLYVAWYFFINDKITLIYFSVAISLPVICTIYKLVISTAGKKVSASSILKNVIITGLLYAVVVKIILTWNLF